jgi:predicted AlkP superfamily phosphohydrolase/phosphomutase
LDRYFQELDRAVAELTALADEHTTVLIVSDHGFGPISDKTVHRLSMMSALGVLEATQKSAIVRLRQFVEGTLGLKPDRARKIARTLLPQRWAGKLEARARDAQLKAGAQELAYSVTLHEYVGGMYLNHERLAGRLEAFRAQTIDALEDLRDPDDGTPLIAKVFRRDELYSGPLVQECPDLIFYLTPGYGLSGGVGQGGRMVTPRVKSALQQGTHRDKGILYVHGPEIVPARSGRSPARQLCDVTATALYLLGLGIPKEMDGAVIEEAISPALLEALPIRRVDTDLARSGEWPQQAGAGEVMDEADQAELASRLRALGYIE